MKSLLDSIWGTEDTDAICGDFPPYMINISCGGGTPIDPVEPEYPVDNSKIGNCCVK